MTTSLTDQTTEGGTRGGGRDWQSLGFGVVFAVYLAGLLLWLAIGLIPSATSAMPAFRRWLVDLAASHGTWHTVAARILSTDLTSSSGRDVAVQYLFSLLNLALGVLLVLRRPRQPVPRLLAFALLGTAATFNQPSHAVFHVIGHYQLVTAIHFMFHVVSGPICGPWCCSPTGGSHPGSAPRDRRPVCWWSGSRLPSRASAGAAASSLTHSSSWCSSGS